MSPIEKEAREYYKSKEMTDDERNAAEVHFIEGYEYACKVLLDSFNKNRR